MMNAAMNILEEEQLDVGAALAHLVQAEGASKLMAAKLKLLAVEEIQAAKERLDRAEREIQDELMGADLNSRMIAELIEDHA